MNLTPKLADKIAARYRRRDSLGQSEFDTALAELLRRDGLAILNEDARRDLILTLVAMRRMANIRFARQQARLVAERAAAVSAFLAAAE